MPTLRASLEIYLQATVVVRNLLHNINLPVIHFGVSSFFLKQCSALPDLTGLPE